MVARKKKVSKKKELATQTGSQLPANLNFAGDVGGGLEGTDKDSFAIPFLTIVQKMSPAVDEADAGFIEDARPGMLMNTVTNELFDGKEGVIFLPCAFQRRFLRWAPRGKGGFKGDIAPEEAATLEMNGDVINDGGRLFFPDSDGKIDVEACDFLSDTRNHFGILVAPSGQIASVLLSLSSTQIKKSKQLMTLLNGVKVKGPDGMVTPPTWVNQVRLTTVAESNEKGSWHGIKVKLEGFIATQELYDIAKGLHGIIAAGKVTVNYAEEGEDEGKF